MVHFAPQAKKIGGDPKLRKRDPKSLSGAGFEKTQKWGGSQNLIQGGIPKSGAAFGKRGGSQDLIQGGIPRGGDPKNLGIPSFFLSGGGSQDSGGIPNLSGGDPKTSID